VYSKCRNQRIRILDTNSAALAFLKEVDETLPDLTAFDLDVMSKEAVESSRSSEIA
jgi:hypothetical protein